MILPIQIVSIPLSIKFWSVWSAVDFQRVCGIVSAQDRCSAPGLENGYGACWYAGLWVQRQRGSPATEGAHPIMRWCAEVVSVMELDKNESIS